MWQHRRGGSVFGAGVRKYTIPQPMTVEYFIGDHLGSTSITSNAGKLKFLQEKLEAGDDGAKKIWESMGVYLGYGIAHYGDFYDIKHVLILARCTSGHGGDLLIQGVKKVFEAEFPELSQKIELHLPDEKIRRVGQSVAAASLPVV